MAKAGTVYYLEFPEGGGRPNAVFIGSSWDAQNEPNGPRKVLSLKKKDGDQWIAPVAIVYEDGSKVNIKDKVLFYKATERRDAHGGIPDKEIPF
jgi:hypothetical protein